MLSLHIQYLIISFYICLYQTPMCFWLKLPCGVAVSGEGTCCSARAGWLSWFCWKVSDPTSYRGETFWIKCSECSFIFWMTFLNGRWPLNSRWPEGLAIAAPSQWLSLCWGCLGKSRALRQKSGSPHQHLRLPHHATKTEGNRLDACLKYMGNENVSLQQCC